MKKNNNGSVVRGTAPANTVLELLCHINEISLNAYHEELKEVEDLPDDLVVEIPEDADLQSSIRYSILRDYVNLWCPPPRCYGFKTKPLPQLADAAAHRKVPSRNYSLSSTHTDDTHELSKSPSDQSGTGYVAESSPSEDERSESTDNSRRCLPPSEKKSDLSGHWSYSSSSSTSEQNLHLNSQMKELVCHEQEKQLGVERERREALEQMLLDQQKELKVERQQRELLERQVRGQQEQLLQQQKMLSMLQEGLKEHARLQMQKLQRENWNAFLKSASGRLTSEISASSKARIHLRHRGKVSTTVTVPSKAAVNPATDAPNEESEALELIDHLNHEKNFTHKEHWFD